MMNRCDMASRRTPKRYPGHVLRELRAERGVGRPPQTMGVDHGRGLGKLIEFAPSKEGRSVKNPKPIARLARRRGVRLTENQAECLAHIERFGDARGYAPATVRSLEDRGLVSAKSGKLTKKAKDILAAVDHTLGGA